MAIDVGSGELPEQLFGSAAVPDLSVGSLRTARAAPADSTEGAPPAPAVIPEKAMPVVTTAAVAAAPTTMRRR